MSAASRKLNLLSASPTDPEQEVDFALAPLGANGELVESLVAEVDPAGEMLEFTFADPDGYGY